LRKISGDNVLYVAYTDVSMHVTSSHLPRLNTIERKFLWVVLRGGYGFYA